MVDAEVTVKDQTEGAGTANVDTDSLVIATKTVHRQRVVIADPTSALGLAKTLNADPATTDYGLVVRDPNLQPKGQKTMANSMPVVIASDQSIISVEQATPVTVEQTVASALKAEVVGPTADNAANPTAKLAVLPVKANAADPTLTEGNVNPLSTDLSGRLRTSIGLWFGSAAPTVGQKTMANSIPIVVSSDQSNVPVSQATAASLKNEPAGNVAHDAVDSGNPIKIGGQARTTNPTAVLDADRVNAIFDKIGRQIVCLNQPRELIIENTITLTLTTETTLLAQAAALFHDLTMVTVINTSATAVRIDFRDTTGGAVRFALYAGAGVTIGFVNPIGIKQTIVNTNWTAQLSAAVTNVSIFAQAVKNV